MPLPDLPPPYGTIVFDCDSTLSAMEGIEVLASAAHAAEIARLTAAAMNGTIPIDEVFGRRLDLIRPTQHDVERIGREYIARALSPARELVAALRALGKRVVIVSGGLLPAVRHFGQHLGVDEVHAVDIAFDAHGRYAGFDDRSPLVRAGGKMAILRSLEPAAQRDGIVLVGDGVTDLEAAPLARRFVAFGGVVRRDAVFREATVTTTSADLRDLVPLLLSPAEIRRLADLDDHAGLARPHLHA